MVECNCAYCQEGMSKTAEECVDRMVEVTKRLRGWNKDLIKDEQREVNMDEIRLEEKLPTIDEFIGSDPDYTGDMTTEEYIRSIRGNKKEEK